MIKNVNVVKNTSDTNPKGMNNVTPEELGKITNSFVENIDCICLDTFDVSMRNSVFTTMVSKLCKSGVLNIKILNLNLLSNKINKAEIDGIKFSGILSKMQSAWSDEEVNSVIAQTNLKICAMYYDDIYTIYKLEK